MDYEPEEPEEEEDQLGQKVKDEIKNETEEPELKDEELKQPKVIKEENKHNSNTDNATKKSLPSKDEQKEKNFIVDQKKNQNKEKHVLDEIQRHQLALESIRNEEKMMREMENDTPVKKETKTQKKGSVLSRLDPSLLSRLGPPVSKDKVPESKYNTNNYYF